MLDEYGAHATFFTLGWIAERYPGLVRRIVASGHELASHGYAHQRASDQNRRRVSRRHPAREDRCSRIVAGVEVKGYRAPSFSIGAGNQWAFECIERGRLPIQLQRLPDPARSLRHARCAALRARRARRAARSAGDDDAPVWPQLAGGRRRLFPAAAVRAVALVAAPRQPRRGQPAIFYFHPWEIDPEQPRVPGIGMQDPLSPLPQPPADGAPAAAALLADFRWDRMSIGVVPGRGGRRDGPAQRCDARARRR